MKRLDATAAAEFAGFAGFIGCLLCIVGLVVCGVRPDLVYSLLTGLLP